MNDLISRKAVLELPRNVERTFFGEVISETVDVKSIEALPVIEPRAKGKWDFIGDNMFMCTSCGAIYTVQQLECLKQHVTDLYIPPYCPNCGADMREVAE